MSPTKQNYPRIPTPLFVYWREFRVQALPVVMFVLVLGATLMVWQKWMPQSNLTGVGEGTKSLVSSPQSGLLVEFKVQARQMVRRGDPIAVVLPVDPRAQLDLLQAKIQIARLRYQPSMAEQNALDYERLRVELMRAQTELAIAKVNLARTENDVRRNTPLFEEKMLSEELHDLSVKTRDAYQAEIEEKTKAIAAMQERMEKLRFLGDPQSAGADPQLVHLLNALETMREEAVTNWWPVVLTAPISGAIEPPYRHAGEFVLEGEPLVSIASAQAECIVAYLRQPYRADPVIGMKAKVTTRHFKRQEFWTQIRSIGPQVEVITNSLAYVRQGYLVDAGLPVILEVPRNNLVRPGEVVDVWLHPEDALLP